MKKIYILFLFIAFSTSLANAQNNKTKKADDLYARLAYTEAAEANQKLLKKGVIIRPLPPFGVPDGMRVTVGFEEDNNYFIQKLKKVLG